MIDYTDKENGCLMPGDIILDYDLMIRMFIHDVKELYRYFMFLKRKKSNKELKEIYLKILN